MIIFFLSLILNIFFLFSFLHFQIFIVEFTKDFSAIAGSIAGILLIFLLLTLLRHWYFASSSSSSSPPPPSNPGAHGRQNSLFQFRRREDTPNGAGAGAGAGTGVVLATRRLKSARPSNATRPGRFIASASINGSPSAHSRNSPNDGSPESCETVVHRFSYRDTSKRLYYNPEVHLTPQRSQRIVVEEGLI